MKILTKEELSLLSAEELQKIMEELTPEINHVGNFLCNHVHDSQPGHSGEQNYKDQNKLYTDLSLMEESILLLIKSKT